MVDRIFFVVMERRGITRAATFNPSFEKYRYGPRKKAFHIVPAGHSSAFMALREAMLERNPVGMTMGADN